jgi:UDP-N-acetylglucosamine:LPS N-acetylglucosamine transferase
MSPAQAATSSSAPRVLVISGSVGAGHDGAARELAVRLHTAGAQVEVRDFMTAVPAWAAWVLREGYLATSRYAPALFDTLFRGAERNGASMDGFRTLADLGAAEVRRWLVDGRFDGVVSTYPVSSQCLGVLRLAGQCGTPAMTYVTDPAVHRAWVHPGVDVHLTVTEASAEQGRRDHGLSMTAAGPLVASRFAATPGSPGLEELRGELDLPHERRVALISAGSLGLGDVPHAAADVVRAGFTAVVLCGRNTRLQRRLAGLPGVVPLGWRTDVHLLMRAADVLVQNAGGLSFTEALVSGLPAITYRPIPGHGRANAAVLDASGLAPWAQNADDLARLLQTAVSRARRPTSWGDPAEAVLQVVTAARRASA